MAGFTRIRLVGAIIAAGVLTTHGVAAGPPRPATFAEHQRQCAGKDGWSDPAPPIRIFANVYDVGTCGIVVLLVTGPQGHVLIDGATAEAVPSIVVNIRRLGFRPADIKLILNSHEHLDHAGGLRALQRATGARVVARAAARTTLETGVAAADDPQKAFLPPFAGVTVDRIVRDGEAVVLGPLRLTTHATPGHAAGSTSWSWTSCDGGTCHAIVYADSVRATAAGSYRFSDHPAYVAAFRASLARLARLPCDLIVTPHPSASDLYDRLAGATPLSDPAACVTYAARHRALLDAKLASEAKAMPPRGG
ncbi:subclass B3 metallo-beta-lactamase [Sphingomonas sp. Leaf17]|uniref:subclass B3 metallo-beta-lactamase n=1 Tax=Sphingomonas sp. Leaf17 TaxID=1735683 RepID=UPI0006F95F17|nr:subclass B3 metallo-beta-lactamase [Sphingomonas sp. Leaf17]KQM65528.1 subclass B3 metallo-beta-lactamase [Sphingomonas sp. Leaf17]